MRSSYGSSDLCSSYLAGGVGDQHVDTARLRRLQCIERHRRGVGVLALRDHGHAVALAPGLQLRDGGGAEGVAGGEHQAAALVLVASRQLADGGGLADAVEADGEDDERPGSGARKSVVSGRRGCGRVVLGGRRTIKKKKTK